MSFHQTLGSLDEQHHPLQGAVAPGVELASIHTGMQTAALATQCGEYCAWIDTGDRFKPYEAAACGLRLRQLLWVRCAPERQAMPAPDTEKRGTLRQTSSAGTTAVECDRSAPAIAQAWQAAQLLLRTARFSLIVLDSVSGRERKPPTSSLQSRQRRRTMLAGQVLLLRPGVAVEAAGEDEVLRELAPVWLGEDDPQSPVCPVALDRTTLGFTGLPAYEVIKGAPAPSGKVLAWPYNA